MNRKLVAITGALMLFLGACTPAQTASYNLSNDSDNFRVMRRVGGTRTRPLKSCTLIMLRTMPRARVSLKQLSMTG